MNAGVEILLGRMESHPEEFQWDNGTARWSWVLRMVHGEKGYANEPWGPDLSFLPDEEIQTLRSKLHSIQGEAFTRTVMRELLVDDEGEKDPHTQVDARYIMGGNGGSGVTLTPGQAREALRLHGAAQQTPKSAAQLMAKARALGIIFP